MVPVLTARLSEANPWNVTGLVSVIPKQGTILPKPFVCWHKLFMLTPTFSIFTRTTPQCQTTTSVFCIYLLKLSGKFPVSVNKKHNYRSGGSEGPRLLVWFLMVANSDNNNFCKPIYQIIQHKLVESRFVSDMWLLWNTLLTNIADAISSTKQNLGERSRHICGAM